MSIQKKGLNRNSIDKFYTKKDIVSTCIKDIKKYLKISDSDIIIEPSAGDGAFINDIKKIIKNYIFFDIEPENKEIIKQNYLDYDYKNILNKYENIHIVGNPPFGRQSSSAIKFIKKSCLFSNTISFILPRSFKKDSLKKYFSPNFHLIYQNDLPYKSFLVNKEEYDVPCIFQIWEKRNYNRKKIIKKIPKMFSFVKKQDSPDISFRRVGVNAGKIDKDIDKSIQSHYFIKFNKENKNLNDIILKLSNIQFNTDNTVGPKSISKQELISEFNKIL